ncbi:MAG: class I SAM-dependent methyltransferase [Magnetovibrio sp.]|nr:class I SAM-dependent methyltransferase [Magnetovibrio sp.]
MAVASPSRSLTLSFLNQALNNIIPVGNIRVLDIGCGSGFISDVLARSGYQGVYTGLDIADRFRESVTEADAFERSFINADAHTFTSDIAYDVVFSFSALEHIPDDAVLINHLNSVVKDNGVHLHIVPSAWGLPLYLWHGLRQYTLSDIEDRFGTQNLKVYALGGAFSFLLHFTFITILEMLLRLSVRKKFCKFYMLMHRMCLRLDRILPFAPSAYVVIKTIIRKGDSTSQQSEVPL